MKYYKSEYHNCPNCFRPLLWSVGGVAYKVKCPMFYCLYYNDPILGDSLQDAVDRFRLRVNPKDPVKV